MNFIVVWSDFAEIQLDQIFEYYRNRAGFRVATKIVRNLIQKSQILSHSPYIGAVEELLLKRKEVYRFVVYTNYKIIYSVDEENLTIKIADVFDTRQNPKTLKRNK